MLSFKKILVPTDFGPSSQHALEIALDLAQCFGGEVMLLHVFDVPSYAYGGLELAAADLLAPLRDHANAELDVALAAVRKIVPRASGSLRCGDAFAEIQAQIAESRPDVVVMGTRGRSGLTRAFLGSVTEKVVRTSSVAVLTVHESTAKAELVPVPLPALA